MQAYSNPKRANNPHALPDVEVFELTATEVAAMDEDLIYEYGKLEAIVEEEEITGGWFWWTCLPGCLPDSSPFGPFKTSAEALADAQENADEPDDDEEEEEEED